jgi:hypothetical protein
VLKKTLLSGALNIRRPAYIEYLLQRSLRFAHCVPHTEDTIIVPRFAVRARVTLAMLSKTSVAGSTKSVVCLTKIAI